jgi:outer membrane immunogenic protein
MNKLVMAGAAVLALASAQPAAAADIPVPAYQPPPTVILFSWTGFYIGAHGGGGWGSKQTNSAAFPFSPAPPPPPLPLIALAPNSISPSGGLAGAQIGANYQVGSWVFGAEADASWSNLTAGPTCTATRTFLGAVTPLSATCNVKVSGLGTIAGKVGWAMDRLLVYSKFGVAWANDNYNFTSASVLLPSLAANETRWGWMVGAGVEYAFLDSWSGRIEYNYLDFGTRAPSFTSGSLISASGVNSVAINIRERISVVKLGINYRFGYTTVGVRY